jgi:hypothetical protein
VFTKEIEYTDFPLDGIHAVLHQQRHPLAKRVLTSAAPAPAFSLARWFGSRGQLPLPMVIWVCFRFSQATKGTAHSTQLQREFEQFALRAVQRPEDYSNRAYLKSHFLIVGLWF